MRHGRGQVALCAFMIKGAAEEALNKNYTFICNGFNAKETGMALVLWVFYTSKILDFFDTIFMVLRGKWRQLSFLHEGASGMRVVAKLPDQGSHRAPALIGHAPLLVRQDRQGRQPIWSIVVAHRPDKARLYHGGRDYLSILLG